MSNDISFLEAQFNANGLKTLCASLEQQMKDGSYDFENNLSILKIYQAYPSQADHEARRDVLVKALMAFPGNDFTKLSAVIPPSIFSDSKELTCLVELAKLLETSKFAAFWEKSRNEDLKIKLDDVKGFKESVRQYITSVLTCAYKRVNRGVLQASLDTQEGTPELDMILKREGWIEDDEAMVVFPASADNQNREKKYKESIHFEQLSGVISVLSPRK